ncbi:MAG: Lrp/AsnC family transcriptional regulator [Gammaproteobacteria bacterium]|nr:Lrp/AsnC family transcriptional regulator [Gammaproteobacteria bacterium]
MVLNEIDAILVSKIQGGLPLVSHPYAEVARQIGISEQEVINRISSMQESGIIKRMGIIVRHHELGYTANAMVVWDVPEERLEEVGEKIGSKSCVTLCYQRPRRLPDWPYNLFCMIHGQQRERVLSFIETMVKEEGLEDIPHKVLFSGRRFKQRGARYQ